MKARLRMLLAVLVLGVLAAPTMALKCEDCVPDGGGCGNDDTCCSGFCDEEAGEGGSGICFGEG
jgi:hypothetical protein